MRAVGWVAICILFSNVALAQNPPEQKPEAEQSTPETEQPPKPTPVTIVGKIEVAENNAADDYQQASEERAVKDFQVQLWMTGAAIAQAIISALALFAAIFAAVFARSAWVQARRQADIASDALYAIERPIILMNMITGDRPVPKTADMTRPFFCLSLENVGKQITTLTMVTGRFIVQKTSDDVPELNNKFVHVEGCFGPLIEQRILRPGCAPEEILLQRVEALTEDDKLAINDRFKIGYFIGSVIYVDPIKKLRNALALFVYDPPSHDFPRGRFIQILSDDVLLEKGTPDTHKVALTTMLNLQVTGLWSTIKREADLGREVARRSAEAGTQTKPSDTDQKS